MVRNIYICLLLLASTPVFSATLSLDEYIRQMQTNDLEVKKFIHAQLEVDYRKQIRLPDHAWTLALSAEYGLDQVGDNDTEENSVSLTKEVLSTGTELQISAEDNQFPAFNQTAESIELRQSLVRNSFGSQSRRLAKLLGEENKVLILEVVNSYEDYLSEKIQDYLDFTLAFENLKNIESLLGEMRELEKEIRRKRKSGIANKADFERILAEVYGYQRQVVEAKRAFDNSKSELFRSFDNPISIEALQPQQDIPYIKKDMVFDLETKSFWASGRTPQILKLKDEVIEDRLKTEKHGLLPEVDLVLGYQKEDNALFGNTDEYVAGLQLSYSFSDPKIRGNYDKAKFDQKRLQLEQAATKKNLETRLGQLRKNIQSRQQSLALTEKQLVSVRRLATEVRKRFRRGVVDLKVLVDTQQQYTQTRYRLTEEKVNLAKLKVRWLSVTDQLVKKNKL